MKKIILAITLVFTSVYANKLNNGLKQQCQYMVYGSGKRNKFFTGIMIGIIEGHNFHVDKKNKTDFILKATHGQIIERACKEALNINKAMDFIDKYNIGLSVTMDKETVHYRTVH